MKVLRTVQEAAVSKKANVLRVHVPVNVANFSSTGADVMWHPRRTNPTSWGPLHRHRDARRNGAPREELPEDKLHDGRSHQPSPIRPGFIGTELPELDLEDQGDFDPGATQKIGLFRKLFGAKAMELDDDIANNAQWVSSCWMTTRTGRFRGENKQVRPLEAKATRSTRVNRLSARWR